MTEAEWLAGRWPGPLIEFLQTTPDVRYGTVAQDHPVGRRRLRLFGVATTRRAAQVFDDPRLHESVAAAEAFADGMGTFAYLAELNRKLLWGNFPPVAEGAPRDSYRELLTVFTREEFAHRAAYCVGCKDARATAEGYKYAALAVEGEDMEREAERQCSLLRDIFGNPFRPVSNPPEWRTSIAIALARGMYESRDFSPMPILADALEEAGCDNDDMLNHCRGGGPHVRGCWAVDLLLGKW